MAARDAIVVGSNLAVVGGLPSNSDAALSFSNGTKATVPHDDGMLLNTLAISLWFKIASAPATRTAILAKDQSGHFLGDFAITVDPLLNCDVQFQIADDLESIVSMQLQLNTAHHMVVLIDTTGHTVWLDGQYIGEDTLYTSGWLANTNDITLMWVPWSSSVVNGVMDELVIYTELLTSSEIIQLSQESIPPVAADFSGDVVLDNGHSITYDVLAASKHIGLRTDVTILPTGNEAHGTVSVDVNNNIQYVSDDLTVSTPDSFTYRIQDANGISNYGTISLTVNVSAPVGSGDGYGGTLVYKWEPLLAWMGGSLTSRNADAVRAAAVWTDPAAATIGAAMVKEVFSNFFEGNCFNRAPTGEPAVELCSLGTTGILATAGRPYIDVNVRLWDVKVGSPRKVRIVYEILFADSNLPTTYRVSGLGTQTTNNYPNYNTARLPAGSSTPASNKIGVGLAAGFNQGPYGGGRPNWWNGASVYPAQSMQPDRAGYRTQAGAWEVKTYAYNYGRPGRYGEVAPVTSFRLDDSGVVGCWNRMELELYLGDSSKVPANAIFQATGVNPMSPLPSPLPDAYVKQYITRNIDGDRGLPVGTRQKYTELLNCLPFCRSSTFSPYTGASYQNMHTLANIITFWWNHYCGGSTAAGGEMYAWIRKVEVYEG